MEGEVEPTVSMWKEHLDGTENKETIAIVEGNFCFVYLVHLEKTAFDFEQRGMLEDKKQKERFE